MLTEVYIEALLVDEDLADQVWVAWAKGEVSAHRTVWMWILVAAPRPTVDTDPK